MSNDTIGDQQPQGGAPPSPPPAHGATSASQGDQSSTTTPASHASSSIEELQRLNTELMRDNAKYRRLQREREEAETTAAETRLKEQGEFKALAEQREARIKELEPLATRFEKLSSRVNEQIKAAIKDWPAEVKAFDPGPSAPTEDRFDWFEKAGPLVAKLSTNAGQYAPGNTPSPRPAGGSQQTQGDVEELRRRMRDSGKYAF